MASEKETRRRLLMEWRLAELLVGELNWNRGEGAALSLPLGAAMCQLSEVCERSGVAIYAGEVAELPDSSALHELEKRLLRLRKYHALVLRERGTEHHLWLCRVERDGTAKEVKLEYYDARQADLLLEKLPLLRFASDNEEDTLDVAERLQQAFALNAEAVTQEFFRQFKKEHDAFANFIQGLDQLADRQAYTSRMLNRLMFCYFLQKKGYLDHRVDYLAHHLRETQLQQGADKFNQTFFRGFLLGFFGNGLNSAQRNNDFRLKYGRIPYINGGMFTLDTIEAAYHPTVDIPDAAFEQLFHFFDRYQWHLDSRSTASGRDINPDVLGYIFEQYINDRAASGAYYTKEDVTGYIAANTIVPKLLRMTEKSLKNSPLFKPKGYVWATLKTEPERFVHASLLKGYTAAWREQLPEAVKAGLEMCPDLAQRRAAWAQPADEKWANPTESWRETIERWQRCEALLHKLRSGKVNTLDALITLNLNLPQFALTLIAEAPDHKLPHHLYQALRSIKILDPTCGSGAFLFAALELLLPLYDATLDRLRDFAPTSADCRDDLAQAHLDVHPNQQYFELKSIILRNLYGVDLMGEAVEIARLRLFLKLVSAANAPDDAKPNLGIEPLPDIDFNLKTGNALVGYVDTEGQPGQFNFVGNVNFVNDAIRQYKEAQLNQGATSEELNTMKRDLGPKLKALENTLDECYFRNNGQKGTLANWQQRTHPLHWVAQYNDILEAGGFDVVIGNPPYVAKNTVAYYVDFLTEAQRKMPDIYSWCVLRALSLTAEDGMLGMIMPLSVTFSNDYKPLRQSLNGQNVWMASFDIRPATLFDSVNQRCTILLTYKSTPAQLLTSRMYRWVTQGRAALMNNVKYYSADLFRANLALWPKLIDNSLADIVKICKDKGYVKANATRQPVYVANTARNFYTVGLESPPCVDCKTNKPIPKTELSSLKLSDETEHLAVYAALTGNLSLLFWMMVGDGMHLTTENLSPLVGAVQGLPPESKEQLAKIGRLLDERHWEGFTFHKNAGKYIGSFNHACLHHLTRRADALLLFALGLTKQHVFAVVEWYLNILSVSNSGGEKEGIPPEIKALYPPQPYDAAAHAKVLSEIDAVLLGYGLTADELRYLTEVDLSTPAE